MSKINFAGLIETVQLFRAINDVVVSDNYEFDSIAMFYRFNRFNCYGAA